MRIVDTHAHSVVDNSDYHYKQNFSLDDLVSVMDSAQVWKATVVQSRNGNGIHNSYPTTSMNGHRDRLVPICGIDATSSDASEALGHRIQVWGASGARIFCEDWRQVDARYQPIWEKAVALKVPVLLCGPLDFDGVATILDRNPALRIVLDHVGMPDLGLGVPAGLLSLSTKKNVSVKYSSYVFDEAEKAGLALADLFDPLVEAYGADRLMWGSNYPSSHGPRWTYQNTVDAAKELVKRYTVAQQEMMLAGAAVLVWPELESTGRMDPTVSAKVHCNRPPSGQRTNSGRHRLTAIGTAAVEGS